MKHEAMICPCCGGGAWRQRKYIGTISYSECRGCSYSVQDRSIGGELAESFEIEQEKFFDENSIYLNEDFSGLDAEINFRRKLLISKWLPARSSIVEVGPGSGAVLKMLKALGYRPLAVEHSEALARNLIQNGFQVVVGDFCLVDLQAEQFDAYCSFHVLEHVVDFKRHLAKASRVVRPGGLAFIATPNTRGWEHSLPFSLSPNMDSSHFQLFSPEALKHALNDTGWEVLKIETPAYAIAWMRVLTKILRRVRGQDESATGGQYAKSAGKNIRLLIAIFSGLTLPFRIMQERLCKGNEAFIIARRRAN